MPITKAFGLVEDRTPYEPAPLLCEAPKPCGVTMHEFVESRGFRSSDHTAPTYHDVYKCSQCEAERIWG